MGALFVSWHLLHLCGFTAFTGDYQASYYNNLILANQMYPFLDGIMSLLLCVCVFFFFFFSPSLVTFHTLSGFKTVNSSQYHEFFHVMIWCFKGGHV